MPGPVLGEPQGAAQSGQSDAGVADVVELGVAVGMAGALDRPVGALQAEPLGLEQGSNRLMADRVPGHGQLLGEVAGRFHRPPQRPLRVPALDRLHQGQ
jgi:hypothetical protein